MYLLQIIRIVFRENVLANQLSGNPADTFVEVKHGDVWQARNRSQAPSQCRDRLLTNAQGVLIPPLSDQQLP